MAGTNSIVGPEWSVLRAACSVGHQPAESIVAPGIQWKFLFALAEQHGVQPLLWSYLSKSERLIPAEELQSLQRNYGNNLLKSMFLARELIRIVESVRALGVEVLPYKGVALAEVVYGDMALRQVGDIDLLIRPCDLRKVMEAARELGYTAHLKLTEKQEQEYLKSGYECAFDGAAGPNLLEVQWAIQPRFYTVDIEMEELFERSVTMSVAGQSMQTLSKEDLFLILCVHAAKHVWQRLIWICDIARIMQLQKIDWTWIAGESERLGIKRVVGVTVLLAKTLLGAEIPSGLIAVVGDDATALELARHIGTRMAAGESSDVESVAYFRLMLRLRERPSDKLRFLSRLVFTPGPGEWAAVSLPEPLFPLYRLVRLGRVIKRLARL